MLQTTLEEEIGKVSKLVIFLCCGSGWQLLSIVKITLKLTGCVAVRVSSYIPFPERHPLIGDSNLLKIHNGSDNNCFLYSYTAGYHLFYKKEEKQEPLASCFRPRTNVLTYSRENPSAKMLKGNFEMPMSLHDISIEDLNEVQVNAFR